MRGARLSLLDRAIAFVAGDALRACWLRCVNCRVRHRQRATAGHLDDWPLIVSGDVNDLRCVPASSCSVKFHLVSP